MNSTTETILAVEGMTCHSCVRHVEAALRPIQGVAGVEVKLAEGRVRVRHDPARATTERMIDALEDAGYASRPIGG